MGDFDQSEGDSSLHLPTPHPFSGVAFSWASQKAAIGLQKTGASLIVAHAILPSI